MSRPLTLDELVILHLDGVLKAIHGISKYGAYYHTILELPFDGKRIRFIINDLLSHMTKVIYDKFVLDFYGKVFGVKKLYGSVLDVGGYIGDTAIYLV